MRRDPRSGFTALFADKQLLNILCLDPIEVITSPDDTRKVIGYVISRSDWHELDRYYTRKQYYTSHYEGKPVLMRDMYSTVQIELNGWMVMPAHRKVASRRHQTMP